MEKTVLLSKSVKELAEICESQPKYVAKQIYGFLADGKDFDEMTSLKKEFREELKAEYIANPVEILEVFKGKLGTKKYLFKLLDGNLIEGVYMPHDYGDTLCLSTQVGCRMMCTFCASCLDGLLRNLTTAEMLGQVIAVNRDNGGTAKQRAITNLVLMGSGEPFDNYDNVLGFLDAVSNGDGINVSERNISLSTSGLTDKIKDFADSGHKVTLSISLHAPFDELRSKLMPVNKRYPIAELVKAARYYFDKTGRRVIFEYTLIKGENDSDACAKELARLTKGFPSHVNLIRLNEVKERSHIAPSEDATNEFLKKLENYGVSATIRKSLGNDVEGACGQLRRRYIEGK
ncbi:MAG: 23S rRNA (adenine(2503)-C(2))-methyltransferase RlmN [Clostridia bacterium]|nr:23S rRNA (adenine(2503)-C(2))-methyltransferase RlmN [Clostridia bacterium]